MHVTLPSRIGLLGDVHGDMNSLVKSFSVFRKNGITNVLQVGDFWTYDSPRDLNKLDRQLALHDIDSLLFLPGNHENYNRLSDLVGSDFARGRTFPISDRVTFLGRGSHFTVGSKFAVALGGADSHDVEDRTPGKSWWAEERITLDDVLASTRLGDADILFSHDAPSISPLLDGSHSPSRLMLDKAVSVLDPELIVHGHLHVKNASKVDDRFVVSLGRNTKSGFAAILDTDTGSVDFLS